MNVFLKIITILLFIILEILVSYLAYRFYNLFPLGWFRDYDSGKESSGQHGDADKSFQLNPRMKNFPDAVWFCSLMVFIIFVFYIRYGFTYSFICNVFTIMIFSYVFVADLKTRIIPDQFIFSLLFVSFFWIINDLSFLNDTGRDLYRPILMRIIGGFIGGSILWLIAQIGSKLLKHEAMGMGDVKLVAACGIITSFTGVFWVLILSFLLAFLPALFNLIKGMRHHGYHFESVPFGPFIVLATTIYLLFPAEFALLYDLYSTL